MRNEPNLRIEHLRQQHTVLGRSPAGVNWGYFERGGLRIISSGSPDDRPGAAGWEHVSVSRPDRTPSWEDMAAVKDLFWADDETVIQFHPCKSAYINKHPYCLHLWRKVGAEVELPPKELIA